MLPDRFRTIGRPRLLILGDLILDRYSCGTAERISPEAPVLVLRSEDEQSRLGGAASVAALLAALQADVALLGVTGADADACVLRRLLGERGIDYSGVRCDQHRPTTVKNRFLGRTEQRNPQHLLRVDREIREPLSAKLEQRLLDSLQRHIRECEAVLISDYAKGVCTPRLLAEAFRLAAVAGVPVLVDPAHVGDYSRYRSATVLTPNRIEAETAAALRIATFQDAWTAGRQLQAACAAEAVVVKLDRQGLALVAGQSDRQFAAQSKAARDVTGAGDMVLAMLGLCRAAGLPWDEAAELANVAAGLQVERLGVAPVSRTEILAELDVAQSIRNSCKLVSLDEAAELAESYRRAGKKIVFTNGCFDLLHAGHLECLQQAAALGDVLFVAVNGDESVRRLKGPSRPVIGQEHRAALLGALGCVQHVLVFHEQTPHKLLQVIRPDVLAKGGTCPPQEVIGREIVEAYGGEVRLTGRKEGVSTTEILLAVTARRTQSADPAVPSKPASRQTPVGVAPDACRVVVPVPETA